MRVAVAGALGKMGRTVCGALASVPGIELVGGFDRMETGRTLAQVLNLPKKYSTQEAKYLMQQFNLLKMQDMTKEQLLRLSQKSH